jgi:hypothetical protein
MKNWKSILVVAIVLSIAVGASAQQYVGVFFDEEATNSNATLNGGLGEFHQAWICAINAEMTVGGAAFKLELDPQILLVGQVWPAGVQIGTLTAGVEVGYTNPIYAYLGTPAILCELSLYTGDNLIDNAELTITNHPNYASVEVADITGPTFEYAGSTSLLTIPVKNEKSNWGDVKNLFR